MEPFKEKFLGGDIYTGGTIQRMEINGTRTLH